jgi:hypothetical protein
MRHLAASVLALLLLGCEPMGPLSGHSLSGSPTEPPDDWTSLAAVAAVQLQTRPGDPYSVNIWGIAIGPDYYVASARGANSSWVGHIAEDPSVQLRIGDALYALEAVRVLDPDELARVQAAYAAKYDLDGQDNDPAAAWVFRLDRPG